MTTVTQIITDAYRQSNLIALGVSPTSAQQTEALRYLNRIVKSVFGNEAGDPLTSLPVGNNNVSRPSGYLSYDPSDDTDWFVPKNVRVVLNSNRATTFYLHPAPDDGTRFAITDTSNNLATYNATVYGNGRQIEGANGIILNTNGLDSEWFYRADLADWLKYAPLLIDDTFPFPEEFDDFFITMLAMRVNPSYGTALDDQSAGALSRARTHIRARYAQQIPMSSELGLIKLSKMAADRDNWGTNESVYDPNVSFNKGFPW